MNSYLFTLSADACWFISENNDKFHIVLPVIVWWLLITEFQHKIADFDENMLNSINSSWIWLKYACLQQILSCRAVYLHFLNLII